MNKSTLFNIIKFIGTKVPGYDGLETRDDGWTKLPKQGWRDENNKEQGEWIYYDEDGNKNYVKHFVDGTEIRRAYYDKNGHKFFEGEILNQTFHGKWIQYYQNENIASERNYVNGKEDGKTIYYYPNGNKFSEVNYVDGKKYGKHIFYHLNGTVYKIENYE